MRVLPANFMPAAFTAPQRAFVEAWYSLTNAQSLDSHRVRTLNARLVLRELSEVCRLVEAGVIKPFHRQGVAEEAAIVLESDLLFQQDFSFDWRALRTLLHAKECWSGKGAPRGVELRVTAEDTLSRLDEAYFDKLVGRLGSAIAGNASTCKIHDLVSALLTDLTDRGFTSSNLYGFHKFFERGNLDDSGQERTFADRWSYLIDWLRRPREDHEVILKLSRASKLATLQQFGGWNFDTTIERQDSRNVVEGKFLRPGTSVVFAKRVVEARDHREAAALALRSWSRVTDLLLFDFVAERLPMDSRYRSVRVRDGRLDMGTVAVRIPNPREWSSPRHLREFSQQVEDVLSDKCSLREEDKRQIEAAMRYLRLGTEATSLEATFITRWIALESLLRTVTPEEPVLGAVNAVSSLMAVTYVERRHRDLRATARYLSRPLPASCAAVVQSGGNTAKLSTLELHTMLSDSRLRSDFVGRFEQWPLYFERLNAHATLLTDSKRLREAILGHARRVAWQVQRAYRTRNEIVHSASHSVSLISLVSHLEYYLRTSARTVVQLISKRPHTESLKDLFYRISAVQTRFDEDLKARIIPPDLLDPLQLSSGAVP